MVSQTKAVAGERAEARPATVAAAPVIPRFSWAYFHNGSVYSGIMLAVLNALPLMHFYGAWVVAPWIIASVGLLLAVVVFTVRATMGDEKVSGWARGTQAALILVWMVSAAAFFITGQPIGWVLSMTIPWSWCMHVIFSGGGKLKATLAALALCALPMLGFMIYTGFTDTPLWVAIPMAVSGAAMVASIASSAQYSAQTFKDLQAALSEAAATRQRLEFAIQSAGDGYFEIDLETMIYSPNPALAMGLGFEPGPKDIDTLKDRIHPEDAPEVFETLDKVRAGETRGWRQELRIRVASGGYRWMQLRAQVIDANAVHGRKLIGTVVDMSAWKTLEGELRAAKDAAEASSKAKSEFLANMSHEIRTPLNGVLGMAQALEGDGLSADQKEKVSVILDSGKSLMALLNDVLDLSKIEAGKLEITPVPGDFLHTMKRTRQLFQAQAEDKGLELFARYSSDFPQRISYDPVRVRQCVSNLLSNAVKFTGKGRVEMAMNAKALGGGEYMVSVDISDTGIGMNEEAIGRLFHVFSQADNSTTRRFGGSGLGLSISRQLARMMGGDIVVRSEEGRGSVFTLTFKAREAMPAAEPAPKVAEPVSTAEPKRSLRGARVLLTDDNAINRQVIKLFIGPLGCEIHEATNGKEALDKIASLPFDIVLLDVHMPVMDGKEAIQRIRASSQPWSKIPVIALTADAMTGDREKYMAMGMTDYVSKPVDQRELVARMLKVLGIEVIAKPDAQKTGT